MVRAWSLTPTLGGDSCLFLLPYPLDDGRACCLEMRAGWQVGTSGKSVKCACGLEILFSNSDQHPNSDSPACRAPSTLSTR